MTNGKVKWFNKDKGWGFITCEDGTDVFVHHSVIDMPGYRLLTEGQPVTLEVTETPKGRQADKVNLVE